MKGLIRPLWLCGICLSFFWLGAVRAGAAPCADPPYGSSIDRWTIENAMYSGSASDVRAAINAAKETRGAAVGCPEQDYTREAPNPTPPSLQTVTTVWESVHAPRFAAYNSACPTLGREWPSAALGAYYARLAESLTVPLADLALIAGDMAATQYSEAHAATPPVTWQGAYAYAYSLGDPADPCHRGGIMDFIPTFCATIPDLCVTYAGGKWSGRKFVVGDFWVSPRVYDGGMAYDHGWTGVMMVEAAIQQDNPVQRAQFLESARLVGAWSAAEPPVRNHNYTAKNVWLLAQLYGLTGDAPFKEAMLDKLERNLKPGVLTDWNADGMVDGMAGQPFSALWAGAQRPGRNWDGHNSLLWYGCMNAWAVTEAYVALRDRGDSAEAAELRPYAVAMLDNLAWELNNLGPAATLNVSMHSIPYPFLIGSWKLAAYENEPHPEWEQAAWVLWNTGYPYTLQNGATANVGLYLLYRSGTPYVPPAQRAQGSDCPDCAPSTQTSFAAGEDACLRVPGEIAPSATFQWSKEGGLDEDRCQGVNCRTLMIPDLQLTDSGAYHCEYDGEPKTIYTVTIDVHPPLLSTYAPAVLITGVSLALLGAYAIRRKRPGKRVNAKRR